METEIKLCECGCGEPAPLAKKTRSAIGHVKGQPIKYINGHNPVSHGTHGMSHTPAHNSYCNALRRCTDPKHKFFKYYGGRGIKFLFTSFEQFFAELGPRPEGKTLDRYPNKNGNYEPSNVRWANAKEQIANRRALNPRKEEESCSFVA